MNWSYINSEKNQMYVMTKTPLQIGEYIEFGNTLGFIERSRSGWLCFVNYNRIKCFGEEPNKTYTKTRVQNEYKRLEEMFEKRNENG